MWDCGRGAQLVAFRQGTRLHDLLVWLQDWHTSSVCFSMYSQISLPMASDTLPLQVPVIAWCELFSAWREGLHQNLLNSNFPLKKTPQKM